MGSAELIAVISATALAIAENSNQNEIELWAAVFTQLGDSLATIAVNNSIMENIPDDKKDAE